MKIDFMLRCCCPDRFKKLYGKLIRDVKKQVGRKKFHDMSITGTEEVVTTLYNPLHPSWTAYPVCQTCRRWFKKHRSKYSASIKLYEYRIKIED